MLFVADLLALAIKALRRVANYCRLTDIAFLVGGDAVFLLIFVCVSELIFLVAFTGPVALLWFALTLVGKQLWRRALRWGGGTA